MHDEEFCMQVAVQVLLYYIYGSLFCFLSQRIRVYEQIVIYRLGRLKLSTGPGKMSITSFVLEMKSIDDQINLLALKRFFFQSYVVIFYILVDDGNILC